MKKENDKEQLKDVLHQIKMNKGYITFNLFEQLKQISVYSGFFDRENRREIWKYLLQMTSKEKRSLIYKTSKKHKRNPPSHITKDLQIILKDQNRCIFFQFNEKGIEVKPKYFVNQLSSFMEKRQNRFDYYQGYYDVAIYFGILFYKKDNRSSDNFQFQSLELFTELYLMDYVSPFPVGVNVFQVIIQLLTEFIYLYDKKIGNYILSDENTNNVFLFSHLSWIITYFTHNINKYEVIGRIMDYLMFHSPFTVYALSAIVICDHLQSIKHNLNLENIHYQMKELDLNEYDFDSAIMKCEQLIKRNKYKIKRILKEYKEKGLEWVGDISLKGTKSIISLYENTEETKLSKFFRKKFFPIVIFALVILIVSILMYFLFKRFNINQY